MTAKEGCALFVAVFLGSLLGNLILWWVTGR